MKNPKKDISSDADVIFSFKQLKKLLSGKEYGVQELKHTVEVFQLTKRLTTRQETLIRSSEKIILIASILHDLGRYTIIDSYRHHTEISPEELIPFLSKSIVKNTEILDSVHRCVCRHSLGSKEKPETKEEEVIFDADNLSIFTKFGVNRWFFKAESWGGSKTVQEAEQALEKLFQKALKGKLFYLPISKEILKSLFYTIRYRK